MTFSNAWGHGYGTWGLGISYAKEAPPENNWVNSKNTPPARGPYIAQRRAQGRRGQPTHQQGRRSSSDLGRWSQVHQRTRVRSCIIAQCRSPRCQTSPTSEQHKGCLRKQQTPPWPPRKRTAKQVILHCFPFWNWSSKSLQSDACPKAPHTFTVQLIDPPLYKSLLCSKAHSARFFWEQTKDRLDFCVG